MAGALGEDGPGRRYLDFLAVRCITLLAPCQSGRRKLFVFNAVSGVTRRKCVHAYEKRYGYTENGIYSCLCKFGPCAAPRAVCGQHFTTFLSYGCVNFTQLPLSHCALEVWTYLFEGIGHKLRKCGVVATQQFEMQTIKQKQ